MCLSRASANPMRHSRLDCRIRTSVGRSAALGAHSSWRAHSHPPRRRLQVLDRPVVVAPCRLVGPLAAYETVSHQSAADKAAQALGLSRRQVYVLIRCTRQGHDPSRAFPLWALKGCSLRSIAAQSAPSATPSRGTSSHLNQPACILRRQVGQVTCSGWSDSGVLSPVSLPQRLMPNSGGVPCWPAWTKRGDKVAPGEMGW